MFSKEKTYKSKARSARSKPCHLIYLLVFFLRMEDILKN